MKNNFVSAVLVILAVSFFTAFPIHAANHESVMRKPIIIHTIHHDVSANLRDIPPAPIHAGVKRLVPNKLEPFSESAGGTDTVLQSAVSSTLPTRSGLSFDGVGIPNYAVNAAPPDTNGDVGLSQYVQIVNEALAVFDKVTGTRVFGPVDINTLWVGFGGGCETNNDGDPVVKYDRVADRWVVTQFSVSQTPYLECVAVSKTNDPTGQWNRSSFSYTNFPDYPKLSVWLDAYYITYNMFQGNSFAGGRVCALDRTKMLAGSSATQQCFQLSTSFSSPLASDMTGQTTPAAGTPNYIMNAGSNSLNFWKFHVDFANSANTTLTGPTNLPVASFTRASCKGGSQTCVPQSQTKQMLDTLGGRLMYRLAYRNLGSGTESLVVNHSINGGGGVAVRWYEIRVTSGSPSVFQQGTFAPDSTYRWMGSIAMDKVGNIALGYSASSSAIHPGIRFTGRIPTDAAGTLEAEAILLNGTGSQLRSLNRWGDYSALSVDPSNDCTFWFTTEYLKSNGTFNWSTNISSFKFTSCN